MVADPGSRTPRSINESVGEPVGSQSPDGSAEQGRDDVAVNPQSR